MREQMITRTINATQVTILAVELDTAETFNETLVVPRVYKDDKKLERVVSKMFDDETRKAVHIVDKKVINKLMGMTEEDFIKNAVELDKETRKRI